MPHRDECRIARLALPARLGADADAVRDPVDVGEVGDHLDRVVDRPVVEPLEAQLVDRLGRVCGRRVRQREREVAERPFPRRQVRAAVVVRGVLGPVCGALVTEVVGVRADSVDAGVRVRDDDREQLPLLP